MHPYFGSGITIAPSGPAYGLDEPAENRVSKSIQAGLHEGLVIDSTVRVQIIFNLIPLRSAMRSFRTIIFLLLVSSTAIAAADNPEVSSLGLNLPSVKSGSSPRGTVTLNIAAPFDIEVSLAADPPGAAKLPGSVIVPAGSNSANFTISRESRRSVTQLSDSIVISLFVRCQTPRERSPNRRSERTS
jgi:hypothetical protein